ncbi:MAG: PAS domain S-box protein [Solirubrobacteraceae bacterium]
MSDPQGEFAPDAPPALRASEVPFRLLVEAVEGYAIFMVDPDARIVSWNAGARRIKGYEADEVLGRPLSLFYTPEDVEAGEPQRLLGYAKITRDRSASKA